MDGPDLTMLEAPDTEGIEIDENIAPQAETIHEKAKQAWESNEQVIVVCCNGEELTGWISSYRDNSFAWEHPDGRTCAFRNTDVADIRIIGAEWAENQIKNARQVMREAFAEDEEFRKVYEDNIACWLMDNIPGLKRGEKAVDLRNKVARLILHNIFA